MLLDIVILPSDKVRGQIGKFAKKINKIYPSPCVVDNLSLIPHISLYHFNINKNQLPSVEIVVKKVAEGEKSFAIQCGDLHVGKISVDISVAGNGIRRLNKKILNACAPLRTGIMPYTFKYKKIPAVKNALANYGTVGTVINYEPHITLLVNMKGFNKANKIRINPKFNFKSSIIAVCQVNRWYQVTKILKKFKVRSSMNPLSSRAKRGDLVDFRRKPGLPRPDLNRGSQ